MTKPKHIDALERCQAAARNGWYPAPQHHLPAEIRRALRRFGIRPAVKECFRNCQRLMLESDREDPALAARLTYVEGFSSSDGQWWFQHAWLLWDGRVLDLTLGPERGLEYTSRGTATAEEIARNLVERGWCAPVRLRENERVEEGPTGDR